MAVSASLITAYLVDYPDRLADLLFKILERVLKRPVGEESLRRTRRDRRVPGLPAVHWPVYESRDGPSLERDLPIRQPPFPVPLYEVEQLVRLDRHMR